MVVAMETEDHGMVREVTLFAVMRDGEDSFPVTMHVQAGPDADWVIETTVGERRQVARGRGGAGACLAEVLTSRGAAPVPGAVAARAR